MKRLSVIIVTYKSEKDIYDCLSSVWKHCDIPKEELEIIVVDNSPVCEPMFGKLKALYNNDIILIHNTHNGGYGQGNNVGIRRATAPLILIMNPDVRLETPFFSKPITSFEQDPNLMMYGVKQMYTPTKESQSSFCFTYMMNGYKRTIFEAICNRLEWYIPRYCYFSGSCFFIRKAPFEAVGLFDEDIFMYGEEDDIHFRMMKRFGPHFKYDKSLRYLHLTSDREPNLPYELTMAKVAIIQHEKKGLSRQKTLKNLLAMCNCRLWREQLKVKLTGASPKWLNMLKAYRNELKKMQTLTPQEL